MKTVWMNEVQVMEQYNKVVAEQMQKGLQIFPATMSGTQGELAHIDFWNGADKVYRVLIYEDSIQVAGSDWWNRREALIITVKEYDMKEERIQAALSRCSNTIWNDHGTELEKIVFYRYRHGNDHYGYSYTTDQEYVDAQQRKYMKEVEERAQRRDNTKKSVITPSKKLVELVKRVGGRGYGNTKLEMIDRVEKREGGYRIWFTVDSKKNPLLV